MPFGLVAAYLKLPVFLLVASRLGGLIMSQPLIGAQALPARIRVLFVVGLAALVTPFVDLGAAAPDRPAGVALAMGHELLLGVLAGLVIRMCFLGVQLGGQLIAQEAGLAFGQVADPTTNLQQSIVSSLYLQLSGVVFLIVGGHRVLVAAALDTFQTIPLLSGGELLDGGIELLLSALTLGAQLAVQVAAPVVLTLFLASVAMGFVSKTLPHFNILTVGFSIKGMIAFVLIAVSLPAALEAFTDALDFVVGEVRQLLGN